ncbi:germination protein YpeB [Longirhabdus pacifica]|uniref:germination protein YpeB n=1 Tax=Longirhabdus pacifica TaxID=2305227 RepID=UPI001008AE3D|nr:germination protein YpeB [Longirhabdus pacifica]
MYKKISAILFPICALLLIGTAYWGYNENQEKTAVLTKAENTYQRSFHDLSYHVQMLNQELGNALAVSSTSTDFQKKSLINIWRITNQAQSEISQLPLTLMPFHKTDQLLSNLSSFTYQTAIRDLSVKPMSNKEIKTLETLYKRTKEISGEIQGVQKSVLADNLKWMDVELELATTKEKFDNKIINGFKLVDKKVSEYDEVEWGPSVSSFGEKNYEILSGTPSTMAEIKEKVTKLFKLDNNNQDINIAENGKKTKYQTFSVSTTINDSKLNMDYTKQGGHLIWYYKDKEIGAKQLSTDQAIEKGKNFLQRADYGDMQVTNVDEYGNVASITYAVHQDNVIIYPAKVIVRVALDNGDITGFQASDYVFENKERTIEEPEITMDEAKRKLNGNFKIQDVTLAIIKNGLNEEVLCYQFTGRSNGSVYRLYINAKTGAEEEIERI